MSRSLLRGAVLWGALLASATVAAAGPPMTPTEEAAHVAVAGEDDAFFVEGKKCSCPNGCAMLKWMKGAMAAAVSSGDKDKIAKALGTIASKPVAGYGEWAAIANKGAAAAKKGDIDGAKASCKHCHKLYQKKYQDSKKRCDGW